MCACVFVCRREREMMKTFAYTHTHTHTQTLVLLIKCVLHHVSKHPKQVGRSVNTHTYIVHAPHSVHLQLVAAMYASIYPFPKNVRVLHSCVCVCVCVCV